MSHFVFLLQLYSNSYQKLMFNFLFLLVRTISKYFKHLFTGTSEIERAVSNGDLLLLGIVFTTQIQFTEQSILRSKKLKDLKQYVASQMHQYPLNEKYLEELWIIKKVPKSKQADIILEFEHLANGYVAKRKIDELRKQRFDDSSEDNLVKLEQLWDLLQKSQPYERITKKWIDIGFQGEDPATDFRGAGLLGLDNLLYYASYYNNEAVRSIKHSNMTKHQQSYFFCAAGLNVTYFLYQLLQEGKLQQHFWRSGDPIKTFHEIYCYAMIRMDAYYIQQPNAGYMEFNTIIKQFYSAMRNDKWIKGEIRQQLLIDYQKKESFLKKVE